MGFLENELEELEDDEPDVDGFLENIDNGDTTTVSYKPEINYSSSEFMDEVDNESVELIVTSPPYNADWAYGSHDDQMDYQTEYIPMLAKVFSECWRVLRPGGRLVINTPTLLRGGSSGGQAILSDIDTLLNEKVGMWTPDPRAFGINPDTGDNIEDTVTKSDKYSRVLNCMHNTGFVHREWVTWNKGFNDAGMAPNGSFPRPWGILLNNMHEGISVYQKPGDREYDDLDDKIIEDSKINKWSDDLCDDVWDISPEDRKLRFSDEEDVPPFPEELVKRCIALWTYVGDTVLDPFLGSGTTCKVAKGMKRESIGYEIREEMKEDIESYIGITQTAIGDW